MLAPTITQPSFPDGTLQGGPILFWLKADGTLCLVNDTTPLPITGTFTSDSLAKATAAAPAYVEGTDNSLSQDLTGNLRVVLKAETTKVIGTINLAAAQTLATVTTLTQWTAGTLVVGAGENVIGKTVGVSTLVTSTVTMSVAGAYATGDYIGTTTTPQAFLLASRVSGNTAWIKSIRVSDKNTTAAVAMELWLFSVTFVAPTDNAAWAISDAEAFTCLGVIPIGTSKWYASSNNKVFSDDTISLAIKPGVTSLFYALVARGTTPSWTSGDLDIGLGILQD